MKIAAYNVENLFDRAKAFNEETAEAQRVIKLEAELNVLFEKPNYTDANKKRMLEIMKDLGILNKDEGEYVILRKIRGSLIKRPKSGAAEIVASGREDWVGWVEHKKVHVNAISSENTGRVIRDVDADILAVVEAEHRIALKQFSDFMLAKVGGKTYPNIMLIDGNDERGIDVGLMTKEGYSVGLMRSHINDKSADNTTIFSRDCPEYCVETPEGENIWILPNHFKSKFGGNDPKSQARRKEQAKRVAAIYKQLLADGHENVVVLGDLNDTPDSDALKPLLSTSLKDITKHPSFDPGEFKHIGTFGLGNDSQKIDFLLLSPKLFARVTACGLFRKGAWPGKKPQRWEVYPELKEELHAASDHHVVWCEIE
ncbi:MAG: endonuclease/exonuclease/phosphatase family protein [Candidatus Pseudobacter hemicellulosilyticus]|uniref:Endonuclease/exonuclease/phosphatase family protein n=1 Tax=Candidatus Pseudobacter hemicellulosilyticus TaxID=3121375 RepID=A0AAJ6BED1_9BACT|nr:MAG: endonuclease/exonuclease/phosphatase family protein [Pseudobacter sp.]